MLDYQMRNQGFGQAQQQRAQALQSTNANGPSCTKFQGARHSKFRISGRDLNKRKHKLN